MDKEKTLKYSARIFTSNEIELIQWTRKQYPNLSRHELASTVCELLEWTTDAGRPKAATCVKLLEELEAEGFLTLPALQTEKITSSRKSYIQMQEPEEEISGRLKDYKEIKLVIAETAEEKKRFRSYIENYHILGYRTTFGSRLSYLIVSGKQELGCIQFSASAWALKERDAWIGWTREDREQRLHLVINNSRYLIFPWVRIANLASHALALAARQVQCDYLRIYNYEPVLLETFVDTERYLGTCYKAAGWIRLGTTQGRGRTGKKGDVSRKDVYMYPLRRDFRKYLTGEKAYRRNTNDEF